MKKLKLIFIGVVIGLIVGLWIGTNIGKGQSIFSNPFAEISLQDHIKQKGNQMMEDTKNAIRDSLKK